MRPSKKVTIDSDPRQTTPVAIQRLTFTVIMTLVLFLGAMAMLEVTPHTVRAQTTPLTVTIDDGGQPVVAGDAITYTIDFGIAASAVVTAQNLSLTHTLPSDIAFQACTFTAPVSGTCAPAGSVVIIAIDGEWLPDESGRVQVLTRTSSAAQGDAISSVAFTAIDQTTGGPLSPARASVTTRIESPPSLALTLDDARDQVQPGDELIYTVTLTNAGDTAATAVGMTVTLPQGTAFVSASNGGQETSPGSRTVIWTPFQLDGHGVTVRTMTAKVDLPLDEAIASLTATADVRYASSPLHSEDVDAVSAAVISGLVWEDMNGNGASDAGEPGLEAIAVQISGRGQTFAPLTTAPDGSFRLAGLGAGDYEVTLDPAPLAAYDVRTGDPLPAPVTLTGGDAATLAFGFAHTGGIGGILWRDDDGDGVLAAGQPGLAGVTVNLLDGTGGHVASAISDGNGVYQFSDLPPGVYRVQVDASGFPPGFAGTYERDGSFDQNVEITLQSGQTVGDVNFGFAFTGWIAPGRIWRDMNLDGVMNVDEMGLPGVQVELTRLSDGSVITATTDVDGGYQFIPLEPDNYRLAVHSATWNPQIGVSADPDGVNDGQTDVTIIAGQEQGPLNFGYGPLDLRIEKRSGANPGQTGQPVHFGLSYANQGAVEAGVAVITETVPENTVFNAQGSAPGWSCADGALSGTVCRLVLGVTPVAASDVVTFSVRITDVMPAHVNAITNTVTLFDETPGFPDAMPADNRSTLVLPVEAAPQLRVKATDGGQRTEPGETLVYTITYGNEGNQDAAGVVIAQQTPKNTHFDAAQSTPGWACANEGQAGDECTFPIGDLPAGHGGEIIFAAVLEDAMPVNVATIDAITTIHDDRNASDVDAELTPVDAAPDLVITSSASATEVGPGAPLQYTLTYTNAGNQDAIGVLVVHTVPDYTTFDAAYSTPGWDCPDGSQAGVQCILTIGGLKAGLGGELIFGVTVDNELPPGITAIHNSAVIAGSGVEQNISNNQDGSVIDVEGPTAIDLVSFKVEETEDGGGLLIRWVTAAERESWGFILYRSTSGDWEEAVRITPHLIQAVGDENNGATYSFEDELAVPGVPYYYWLQELELTGYTVIYGPTAGMIAPADDGGDDPVHRVYFMFLPVVTGE
jgi:uncharacterized repeat protein (TIGR01451 family)